MGRTTPGPGVVAVDPREPSTTSPSASPANSSPSVPRRSRLAALSPAFGGSLFVRLLTTVRLWETKVKSASEIPMFSREFCRPHPQLWRRFPQDPAVSSPGHPQLVEGVPGRLVPHHPPSWPILVTWTISIPTPMAGGVAPSVSDWPSKTGPATALYEYSAAVDPIGSGATSRVPIRQFPTQWHDPDTTRVVDLDLSDELDTPYPATGPSLLARFLCIAAGDELSLAPNATSMLFYCLRGRGYSEIQSTGGPRRISWRAGDVVTAPGGTAPRHHATRPRCCTTSTTHPCSAISVSTRHERASHRHVSMASRPEPGWPRWPLIPTPPGAAEWPCCSETPATTRP